MFRGMGEAPVLSPFAPPKALKDLVKRSKEVQGRLADATTARSAGMKYALIGGGGLLVAGVVLFWVITRKGK